MPLRVLVCGTTHTPSVDAVLALMGLPQPPEMTGTSLLK